MLPGVGIGYLLSTFELIAVGGPDILVIFKITAVLLETLPALPS